MGTRDQLGVDAGWGTDRVPVDPEQGLDVVRGFTVQLLDRCLCSGRTAIGHDGLIDGVQTPECHSVQYPDPTDSREANAHAQTLPTLTRAAHDKGRGSDEDPRPCMCCVVTRVSRRRRST